MFDYFTRALKKYAEFNGRDTRPQFWYFVLLNFLISSGISIIGNTVSVEVGSSLSGLYSLAVLLPGLAISVRRLHDIGKSGWNMLWSFLPLLGWIYLIYLHVLEGEPGSNEYGPDPRESQFMEQSSF